MGRKRGKNKILLVKSRAILLIELLFDRDYSNKIK